MVRPDPFKLVSFLCSLFLQPILYLESVVFLKQGINHTHLLLKTPFSLLSLHSWDYSTELPGPAHFSPLSSQPLLSCTHTPCTGQTMHCPKLNPSSALHLPTVPFSCFSCPRNQHSYLSGCRNPGVTLVSLSPSVPTFNLLSLSWIIPWTFTCQCPWHSCPFVLSFPLSFDLPPWKQPAVFLLTSSKEAFRKIVTSARSGASEKSTSPTSHRPTVSPLCLSQRAQGNYPPSTVIIPLEIHNERIATVLHMLANFNS